MKNAFASRINPYKFNFSPQLTTIVGAIIGFDYGVRDRKGDQLTSISITSDGYIITGSTARESGAFTGDARDLEWNLSNYRDDLSDEDRKEFDRLYAATASTSKPSRPCLGNSTGSAGWPKKTS